MINVKCTNLGFIMKVSEDLRLPSRQIQMVDLRTQYQGIADEIQSSFQEIITTTAFINGPYVKKFQAELEEYLGASHVIPCGNGTDALQIAMMALDLKPGDEVIVPGFTFIASVEVIALLGLTPVIVDVYDSTFNMNVEQIEEAISPKTKAILPVHLFGQCANMKEIKRIADKHDLYVIEDNAQSIGARFIWQDGQEAMSGSMGDFGCLSFYPSKNLGCFGDGGAVITNDDALAEAARSITNHGMSRERYYHDRVGVNSRLDSFQAAVLSAKLRNLDGYCDARNRAADYYDEAFKNNPNIEVPARAHCGTHVFHQYTIKVSDGKRDALKEFLGSKGVPTMIYYPVPLQDQDAFKGLLRMPVSLDTTRELSSLVLSLPMHSELDEEQLAYIVRCVEMFFEG